MKIAIMQPYFFPYIGYFQAINAVDKYILYHNLQYSKESWTNGNHIILETGNKHKITVPIFRGKSTKLINETAIDNTKTWKKKMSRTIYFNYKHSHYFDEIYALIEEIINTNFDFIHELNIQSITRACNYLGITTKIETDNQQYQEIEDNLKNISTYQNKKDKEAIDLKTIRALEICRKEKASSFINAIGGQKLYDKNIFEQHGLHLSFIKTSDKIKYNQNHSTFTPNLSIIDVLMHNGREKTSQLLNEYTLV